MKSITPHRSLLQSAFTLIELLVVIAIIATLAALIMPVSKIVAKTRRISVAQAELNQVKAAIESYKAKTGFYPPDNPGNPVTNQLYYELEGTILTNSAGLGFYLTLDGNSRLTAPSFLPAFGSATTIRGFMNSSKSARGSDDSAAALNFLTGLKANQIGRLSQAGTPMASILVCSVPWADDSTPPIALTIAPQQPPNLNPWRYVSTNPTNNPGSYDLWVDLFIGNQTYRISNWSKQPQIF
jgi:prepilin-type N-terminal cleavage/methylation domain-containing protein